MNFLNILVNIISFGCTLYLSFQQLVIGSGIQLLILHVMASFVPCYNLVLRDICSFIHTT